jgi:hypothetical protein
VEHPDLAQISAVVAAAGAALLLAGRGRVAVLGGLVLLALSELGLVLAPGGPGQLEVLATPSGAGALALGALALTGAAALLVRRPGWTAPAILVAAPLRPPISLDPTGGGFPLALAEDGRLGRLLPLYFVLAAATLALGWRATRGPTATRAAAVRGLARPVALPAAAFIAFASLSLLWARALEPGVELLAYFTLPFALLLGIVARSPLTDRAPRTLAWLAIGAGVVFAAIGLFQAATRQVFFFAPNLDLSNANADYFRVTSLFGDPSLYGRHVVLAIGVVLVLLALPASRGGVRSLDPRLGIVALAVLWAGLFFSYSQSSMVALVAITFGVAWWTGGRAVRLTVLGGIGAAALVGAGLLTAALTSGDSLRRETADRSVRARETARVVGESPLVGVGIGGQPRESQRLSDRRSVPTANYVSHTAPLTVAAELGVVGLALYAWLLAGGVRMIWAVRRLEPALGLALAAAFLGLFVHALFYSGFLEDPLTWVVLGVGAAALGWSRRDDGARRERPAATVASG